MSTDELLEALVSLDSEFRAALIEALEKNPEELRAFLESEGYGPSQDPRQPSDADDSSEEGEWTVIGDEEGAKYEREEAVQSEAVSDLTPAEQALYSVIRTVETPRSTSQVVEELIEEEHPELLDEYSSLKNRGWVSSKLNMFAKKGLVGKYREGREVHYTGNIEAAVRNWALQNRIPIKEVTVDDAGEIASDAGMNYDSVAIAIKNLTDA